MKKILKHAYFATGFALLLSSYAFAYLDPATLTYVIQIVAGVVIAGGAAVGIFWKRIRLYFKKKIKKHKKAQAKKAAAKAQDNADA
jgi:mannose/fructose/N-acetylgalactosamine-specific phosphotransferase system component IIC